MCNIIGLHPRSAYTVEHHQIRFERNAFPIFGLNTRLPFSRFLVTDSTRLAMLAPSISPRLEVLHISEFSEAILITAAFCHLLQLLILGCLIWSPRQLPQIYLSTPSRSTRIHSRFTRL
ncbi:hypothetical protein BDZ89DRAFT_551686 [Hymenopellis radicata]|nr:hypothetical protein BDZ89DRAFT_551686 [Hymenopellis radicata]